MELVSKFISQVYMRMTPRVKLFERTNEFWRIAKKKKMMSTLDLSLVSTYLASFYSSQS